MLEPKVRQMIVCEDARSRLHSPEKVDIFGIINKVRSQAFPSKFTMAVYLCLTDGRGKGSGRIEITWSATDELVYVGSNHTYDFDKDPLAIHMWVVRIPSCSLPGPGLYVVDFVYNELTLESCTFRVEEE